MTGEIVRCRNWEDEPEICGQTCGVPLGEDEVDWIDAVLNDHEWFIVLRHCVEHERHADPFCSLACFMRYHARHEHA